MSKTNKKMIKQAAWLTVVLGTIVAGYFAWASQSGQDKTEQSESQSVSPTTTDSQNVTPTADPTSTVDEQNKEKNEDFNKAIDEAPKNTVTPTEGDQDQEVSPNEDGSEKIKPSSEIVPISFYDFSEQEVGDLMRQAAYYRNSPRCASFASLNSANMIH